MPSNIAMGQQGHTRSLGAEYIAGIVEIRINVSDNRVDPFYGLEIRIVIIRDLLFSFNHVLNMPYKALPKHY